LLPIFEAAFADLFCRPFLQAFCRLLPASANMGGKGVCFVNVNPYDDICRPFPSQQLSAYKGLLALSTFANLFIANL
jgi:hypothetical protein